MNQSENSSSSLDDPKEKNKENPTLKKSEKEDKGKAKDEVVEKITVEAFIKEKDEIVPKLKKILFLYRGQKKTKKEWDSLLIALKGKRI